MSKNIFEDLGFDKREAANLKARSTLMREIIGIIRKYEMTQVKAAEYFGTTQSRISKVMNGKINEVTTDALVGWLGNAGVPVALRVGKCRVSRPW